MYWRWYYIVTLACLLALRAGVANGQAESFRSSEAADSLREWASMTADDPNFSIAIPLDRDPFPTAFDGANDDKEAEFVTLESGGGSKRDGFVTLYDCARRGFNVNISLNIGTQTTYHRVMVDTGSSNVVVASSACVVCPVPRPFTAPSGTTALATNVAYTTGSGTTYSSIYSANVSLTGLAGATMMNAQFYAATSSSGSFWTPVGCYLDVETLTNGDGLFGLGPQALSGSYGTSMMDALGGPSLAFQHCESGGTMWLGQPNSTYFSEAIQYTPMYEAPYYVINPIALAVGGVDLNFSATDFANAGNAILDNGATNMFFPTAMYNAIMAQLNANPWYYYYFGSNFPTGGPCIAYPGGPFSTPFLNANMPNITITFESGANMTIRPVDGYLQQILVGDLVWYCNNIAATSGSMRLGLAAHAQFIFQYDRPNHRFGFARTKTCDNTWNLTPWSSVVVLLWHATSRPFLCQSLRQSYLYALRQ